MKKLAFSLLVSLSSALFAAENIDISKIPAIEAKPIAISIDYELAPYQPQTLTNYLPWTVKAQCTVLYTGTYQAIPLSVTILAKKGSVNGVPMVQGETRDMMVYPNETLQITADSAAKVRITNTAEYTVRSHCVA